MTGDAELSTASPQQRQPRRNKVTAEIYKPPAARVQQRPQPPDTSAASTATRGGNNPNRKQPSSHHNLNVTHANHKPQHAKSPRSNRRKHPQNGRLSMSERSSCSPESSFAREAKPVMRDYPSSCEVSSTAPSPACTSAAKPTMSNFTNGAGEANHLRHETSVEKLEVGLRDVTLNNDEHPPSCTPVPNDDLRNYLNRKKQADEIKSLCNAVETASNKYFNKTASPYKKESGESCHVSHDHNHRNNNRNLNSDHHHNGNFSGGYVDNMIRNSGQNNSHYFNNEVMSDSRRARPDQVLYVPRGRRQYGGGGDAYRFSNNYNSPLTDHNYRPPSPAFSITSIVSEFSGRQRYDGESFSRPSSRLSIYDTDDERFDGRPPHNDRRYNSSRESTPGTSKPMGNTNRFSHNSSKLMERSLNQNSVRPSSRNGDMAVNETYDCEPKESIGDSQGMKHAPEARGDRVTKSPTPNRDSVHSKENMVNPVSSSPKKRRSRKNRKRRSHSRDHSYDSMSRDRGSLGNISLQSGYSNRGRSNGRGYHRPQENSYTVYNSSMVADGPASLATSRVNSRNPSLERYIRDDWRQQKPVTCPNTPVRSLHFQMNSRAFNDINSFDGPSSLHYGTDNLSRRNSTDKPPTGKPRPANDSKRNSFSNRMPDSCSNSARGTPTENLSPTDEKSTAQTFDHIASPKENKGNIESAPSHALESHIHSDVPACPGDTDVESSNSDKQNAMECPREAAEVPEIEHVPEPVSPLLEDDDDDDEEPLDWAAEMDREDQRQQKLREQRKREEALQAESKHSNGFVGDQPRLEKPSRPSYPSVDERTRRDIGAAIGRDADITPPRHDFSAYETSTARQLYIPPNERRSPNRNNGSSPPRPRLQKQYSPPCGGDDQSSGSQSSDSSLSPTADENCQSGLAHVLELYDFPSSFRTADLVAVYQGCQAATALDIKWVNDTSALAVFSSVALAERALQLQHAQIKSVRLSEASAAAKSKAVTIEEELLPARPRPQTSMMLARRLLSGALGVRVNLSREEREREAKAIRDAKDHKRQVAKQKADVWEGNV